MTIYATKEQLAEYLGIADESLPFDADRLLDRASELIETTTLRRSNRDLEVARKATCAQVEYWMNVDESMDIMGSPDSISLGGFSSTQKFSVLAPRAKRLLFMSGMLSRSVRLGG